ncbi:MAG: response regulator [Calditrichaeota bacterium]|nr:MAG: response regulator [Calditrichota bacterium]MBL1206231.1 response regulator [Calditrichota bacterium]NOG46057.1 response regulator [Calditrichota bacterium]
MDTNTQEIQKKVLIADDDYDLLEKMKIELQSMGFSVVDVQSQADAEAQLEHFKPDLAIFDLMMENQDSGFILSYKAKKKYPDVPVMLVTGVTKETGMHFDTSTEEMQEWLKADVVLNKDVRLEQLKAEIDQLLKD